MRKPEEILKALLETRGISSEEEIKEFLSDRPQKTYDPFLLLNMEAGVDLLLSEIKNNAKICIYGDYDADGVTSVCILSHVLSMLTDDYTYYIPSRFDEGYGLNKEAVRRIYESGVSLIVTVDCGSVSWEEVEYAKALGMKVIVTDHHSIDDVRADCILINPKQQECRYPFKSLAGCGVAFKLAQAILQKAGLPKSAVNDVLDLAAIGTVGDVVSLTDENRTIVKYGLNRINSGSRESLAKLCRAISLKWVSSENIAFGIAPHINAAGRMAGAAEAVELFTSKDETLIDEKVENLVYYNGQRKKKQEEAYNQGMKMIRGDENFIVLQMDDIHEGIGGIVAGKIKETAGRPVIIVTPSGDGYLKGTGRSTDGVDIYAMLKGHSSLFERFGGHSKACGFLMKKEKLPALRAALDADIIRLMTEDDSIFQKTAAWDMELRPEEITMELADILEKLEPVGEGNPKPSFIIRNVELKRVQFMGADRTHARFTAGSPGGVYVGCVLFQKAQMMKALLTEEETVDIIGSVEKQSWNGQKKVQFIVEEIIGCR
ncbi:MAG: single-stranded-DNA-specific exonuclease RecJ [Anaerovoracaceae bacterium]|nr:single-stranded-DNA-specific exonuclease RecJ [Anaerovoracaceae bacterium]